MSIVLWILTLCSIFFAIKTSNEPVFELFKATPFETLFKQFNTGNSFIFNLSIGFLVSVIIYLLIVWIPDRRRKSLIKHNIEEQYRDFKENTIYILLEACSEGANSDLVSKLCDQNYFRDYFRESISDSQTGWHAVFNGIAREEYFLKELSVELGILSNEVTFVRNNVNIDDQDVFSFFRRLSHSVYKLKNTSLEDNDLKILTKFLWEIFAGWSMIDGPRDEDIVKVMIAKI